MKEKIPKRQKKHFFLFKNYKINVFKYFKDVNREIRRIALLYIKAKIIIIMLPKLDYIIIIILPFLCNKANLQRPIMFYKCYQLI